MPLPTGLPRAAAWTRVLRVFAGLTLMFALVRIAHAQDPAGRRLKALSLEELMALEVTSVSRTPQPLWQTASAIQVITPETIRRSGATTLPEVLRLVTNLQVAQVNASQWAISARGFNNVLANKLLVLIDGRVVYTPLYAGVFWDVQNLRLESIERIEVISGPGGALWGANAVNGVINIITKSADQTTGLAAQAAYGDHLRGTGSIRYGGQLGGNTFARAYAQGFDIGSTLDTTGADSKDSWHLVQGGFRLDQKGERDVLTFQGDYYEGRPNPDGATAVHARGGNALARWARRVSPGSDYSLLAYYDRTYRDFRNGFTEDLATYNLDWQHRIRLSGRQELIWGLGARVMRHQTENLELFEFLPSTKTLHFYSLFFQDELILSPDRLRLALGSKFEHNAYTGLEVQPSARLAWTLSGQHTVWGAVSRAIRSPARIDRDFVLSLSPGVVFIGQGDFESEEVLAYELGWRAQPTAEMLFALSSFYNDYDNLRSVEPGGPPLGIPVHFENGVEGHTYGVELALVLQPVNGWRLRGGYTFLKKDLSVKPGSDDLNEGSVESNDPEHQFLIQSSADLLPQLELDGILRYVDDLPNPDVPSYTSLDLRIGWKPTDRLELSVGGKNLLEDRHPEFVPSSPSPRLIERSVYAQVTWR